MIHKQILAVQKEITPIAKTKQADGFQYRGVEDVSNALFPLFKKHEIFCVPETLSHQTNNVGKTLVECRLSFFASDGSSLVATARGEAIDKTGDKGTTIAQSIATRIILTTVFLIPTEDNTPWITPHLFEKASKRIKDGDFQLFFKLTEQYRLTNEQKNLLQFLIKK